MSEVHNQVSKERNEDHKIAEDVLEIVRERSRHIRCIEGVVDHLLEEILVHSQHESWSVFKDVLAETFRSLLDNLFLAHITLFLLLILSDERLDI